MIVVVDANIIVSALIGSKRVLALLLTEKYTFYAPKKMVLEVEKYAIEICKKAGYTQEHLDVYLTFLFLFVHFIDETVYSRHMDKATFVMGARDLKDADYIAAALAIGADFIWTEDKDFTAQNLIPVKTTSQFIDEQKGNGRRG